MKRFESFRLDETNQNLWRGESRVELTPKAFGVLDYLVEHAGRLVSQEELLNALWPGTYVNPEVLRKYVLEIRRALGDRPDKPAFIETRPKRGYQFVARVIDESLPGTSYRNETRFVGREAALSVLRRHLTKALHNEPQVLFITGEPGIGKTTVVDEFQRQAHTEPPNIRIARGQCVEGYGGREPYYSVLEAVGQLCRISGEDFRQTLERQAPTWFVQFPGFLKNKKGQNTQFEMLGVTPERMLREISEALETISSEKPILLILEDLHWADHSTVDFISALARRRQSAKLMLIGTYRPVDVAVSGHPLRALKQDLLIHNLCQEIALQPLAQAEVAEYVRSYWQEESVPEGLAEFIYQRSEGTPLFMVAVLQDMKERQVLTHEKGELRLALPLSEISAFVPESLRQMIEIQIERLSSEERQALEAASVAGVVFSTVVTASAANMSSEELETVCEKLSRRHEMVRSAGPQEFPDGTVSGRYEFVHELYRQVLYRRQSHVSLAQLHLKVGERLEGLCTPTLSEIAAELAYHFEEARDWPRAIHYLLLAAEVAGRRFEPRQSLEILEHALGLKDRIPGAERAKQESMILERLATIHIAFVGVNAYLKKAWQLILTNSSQNPKPIDRALEVSAGIKDPVLRARTVIRWTLCNVLSGEWKGNPLEQCGEALTTVREGANRIILGSNLIDYSIIQFFSSYYPAAYQHVTEGLKSILEESENNPYLKEAFLHQFVVPWSLLFSGEWGKALYEIDKEAALMDRTLHYAQARANRLYRAFLSSFALDFAGVLEICEPMLGQLTSPSDLRFCSILIASAELNLGNYKRADALLCATQQNMERQEVMLDWYRWLLMESAFTELCLAKGEVGKARAAAERFLKSALVTEERTWRTLAWETSARTAVAELDLARAKACVSEALSTMEGFELPLAAWRLHGTAYELYHMAGDRDLAQHHRDMSRDTIMKLANSLPTDEPLRDTFLSGPRVRNVLGPSKISVPRTKDVRQSGH